MKNILLIFAVFVSLTAFTAYSGINEVVNALKSGSSSQLAKHFDNSVDISVGGKSKTYTKAQGEVQLGIFFSAHAVKNFSLIHKGNSGGAQFGVGTLVTSSGTFRVSFQMRNKNGNDVLQEIRFE